MVTYGLTLNSVRILGKNQIDTLKTLQNAQIESLKDKTTTITSAIRKAII